MRAFAGFKDIIVIKDPTFDAAGDDPQGVGFAAACVFCQLVGLFADILRPYLCGLASHTPPRGHFILVPCVAVRLVRDVEDIAVLPLDRWCIAIDAGSKFGRRGEDKPFRASHRSVDDGAL